MNNANRHNTRLVFSRFSDFRENLGNVKETPTRKTCYSREMKRLALRCKILCGGISLMSMKSLLYFHEKEMLN